MSQRHGATTYRYAVGVTPSLRNFHCSVMPQWTGAVLFAAGYSELEARRQVDRTVVYAFPISAGGWSHVRHEVLAAQSSSWHYGTMALYYNM